MFVLAALNIPVDAVYAWTDSRKVLNWLDGNPRIAYRSYLIAFLPIIGNMCQVIKTLLIVPLGVSSLRNW